jgi:hypothetical protein
MGAGALGMNGRILTGKSMRGDQLMKNGRDARGPTRPNDAARRQPSSGRFADCSGPLTDWIRGLIPATTTGFVTLTVALVVTLMATVVTEVDSKTDAFPVALLDEVTSSAAATPTASAQLSHCALQYAAVLDLAELHRNDGASSNAYRSALGTVSARLNDCTPDEHHADTQS